MKRSVVAILCVLLCCVGALHSQVSVLSLGLRGGGDMYLTSSSLTDNFGFSGMADLRYTLYMPVGSAELGFATGVAAGYGSSLLTGRTQDTFSNTDYLGNKMDYVAETDIRQTAGYVQVEVPLLFTLRASGFVVSVGPKLMLPLAVKGTLAVQNSMIDAYYEKFNVHVKNELITGKLEDTTFPVSTADMLPRWNLLVGAEIGYEWRLGESFCLGVAAYADYAVWNSWKAASPSPFIEVAPISDAESPAAMVTVNTAEGLLRSRNYLDVGLRLSFSVCFEHNAYDSYRLRYDHRKHRPRLYIQ